jgi:hypothetical protein
MARPRPNKRRGSRRSRTSSPYPSEAEMEEIKATFRSRIEEQLASARSTQCDITEADLLEIFLVRIAKLEREVIDLKAWKAEVIASYAPA